MGKAGGVETGIEWQQGQGKDKARRQGKGKGRARKSHG